MSCEYCEEKITGFALQYDSGTGKFLLDVIKISDFKGNYMMKYDGTELYFKNKDFESKAKKILKKSVKTELLKDLKDYNKHGEVWKKNAQKLKSNIRKLEKAK